MENFRILLLIGLLTFSAILFAEPPAAPPTARCGQLPVGQAVKLKARLIIQDRSKWVQSLTTETQRLEEELERLEENYTQTERASQYEGLGILLKNIEPRRIQLNKDQQELLDLQCFG